MSTCLELIYDRFGIDFYPLQSVNFANPIQVIEKFMEKEEVEFLTASPILSVGNYPAHSDGKIRANDTASSITTTVKEKKSKEVYEVEVHFEFKQPLKVNVDACEEMDAAPCHIVLNRFNLNGTVADRRIIRNGEGNSRTEVTEENGVINVDIKIQNVNGIQLIG